MVDFENTVVIVTGAAGHLGSVVARNFQLAGASLVLTDHASNRLQALFPQFAQSPGHLLVDSVDSTDSDAVEAMISQSIAHFGRIDVLVNTVGGFRAGRQTHETSLDIWDSMINLNSRTVFIACRAVIPHMIQQSQGKIVNISARAALSGAANMAAYSASKSAVIRLTESISAELKHQGINVNCVLPGTIDTPDNREAMPDSDRSRWVSPEAIGDVVLFLASEGARAIHGAAIPVYGRS